MSSVDHVSRMHIAADEGEVLSFMGMDLVWKITKEMSRGAYSVFIQAAPPGTGVPMHIHHRDEESIYLLEGALAFQLGEDKFDVHAGDVVNMPKGAPHGFRVTGESTARVLFTLDLSPESDYEMMFAGLVGLSPTDFEQIKSVCAANDVEFLDPPALP
jgi:quercetin dioxygenase-like cupin family protein